MCLTMRRRLRTRKLVFSTMARLHPTRWLLFSVLAAMLSSCASAQPSPSAVPVAVPSPAAKPVATTPVPVRAAPTRPEAPKLWPVTTIRGTGYIDVRDIAGRFGLKADWAKNGPVMTLSDKKGVRFTFEERQRDFYFDGLRIFLGEAAVQEKDTLWLSNLDVIKTVAPLFRPQDYPTLLSLPLPKLVVLDAGHGGTDPGKQNLRFKLDEKHMTLDVTLRLKKILESRGFRVLLTRDKDMRFSNSPAVDLPWRTEIANKAGADLFLSIHFNAVANDVQRVSGSETYVLTPQHMVSTQPESDKSMIGERYSGNSQDTANALLGYNIHRQLITGLKTSDRGYKRYRYAVLRNLNCPGVLIEAGFLSNDAEARRVGTPEYRQQIAEAIADGVYNYSATLAALQPKPAVPMDATGSQAANKESR